MAEFMTSNIRNIALMGHGSEGKTTLMESMLFAAGQGGGRDNRIRL